MAPPPGTLRVGRYLLALLALFAVLYTIVFLPGNRHKPKLGIDLVGGIRVVFTALTPPGTAAITSTQMTQARQIIEDRINTTGVTGSTVVVQGNNQLVVEIPGGSATDVHQLGEAAVLNFRGLIAPGQPVLCGRATTVQPSTSPSSGAKATGAPTPTPTPSKDAGASRSPNDAADRPLTKATATPARSATSVPAKTPATAAGTAKASPPLSGTPKVSVPSSPAQTSVPCSADPIAPLLKNDKSLAAVLPNAETCPSPAMPTVKGATAACRPYSALSSAQQQALTSALQTFKCDAAQSEPDLADRYYIACDDTRTYAYLLGHVVVPGRNISDASAQAPSTGGNSVGLDWTVALTLDSTGGDRWSSWTSKYHTTDTSVSPASGSGTSCSATGTVPCSDFVGFTLDGKVLSLPRTEAVLSTQTSVSGSFTPTTAGDLARELNYGKLPISFRSDDSQNVSATLGSSQLRAALLAGGIGLVLVVLYSLIYYRALGLITIASLLVSAGLTYAMLVILATQIGFTLDLSGIAGFIVALGITADSFVVFFERIKDEVHDGRSLRVAIPRAWVRARRTVLSADTVSFLAAAILYFFASADVKGFAFTLGMSTILDLVVVFLFTHPIVSLLSRSRAFGSARFTGLSNARAGGITTVEEGGAARRPAQAGAGRGPRATRAPGAKPVRTPTTTSSVAVLDDGDSPSTIEAAGTAAERAARRRARLRDPGGAGTDEDGQR